MKSLDEQKQTDNLLTALIKFIREIFSKKEKNANIGVNHPLQSDNDIAKYLIETQNDVISMVNDFCAENKDQLTEGFKKNKINDIKELVKKNLMPNINAYLETKELPDDVISDPNRRIRQYRENIMDQVNAYVLKNTPEASTIQNEVNGSVDNKLSEPAMSHGEKIGNSPRTELKFEVTKEIEAEMTAESPTDLRK